MSTDDHAPDPPTEARAPERDAVPEYEIRVVGHLGARWSTWFDGLAIDRDEEGITLIRGPVVDQAALHGLIQKLRDLGIPLISLTPVPSTTPTEPPAHPEGELP